MSLPSLFVPLLLRFNHGGFAVHKARRGACSGGYITMAAPTLGKFCPKAGTSLPGGRRGGHVTR
jgi:hypothetical protein